MESNSLPSFLSFVLTLIFSVSVPVHVSASVLYSPPPSSSSGQGGGTSPSSLDLSPFFFVNATNLFLPYYIDTTSYQSCVAVGYENRSSLAIDPITDWAAVTQIRTVFPILVNTASAAATMEEIYATSCPSRQSNSITIRLEGLSPQTPYTIQLVCRNATSVALTLSSTVMTSNIGPSRPTLTASTAAASSTADTFTVTYTTSADAGRSASESGSAIGGLTASTGLSQCYVNVKDRSGNWTTFQPMSDFSATSTSAIGLSQLRTHASSPSLSSLSPALPVTLPLTRSPR